MRFLFYGGGSYIGGMERVLLTLMSGLQSQGHAVKMICGGWNDGAFPAMLRDAGVPFVEVKLSRLTRVVPHLIDGLRNLPRAAALLRREAADFAPDVIIHVDIMASLSALPFLPRNACHIMHVHNAPGDDFDRPLARFFLKRIDGFIGVSAFIAKRLAEKVGTDRGCFVHNGVEKGSQREGTPRDASRMRFGIVGQILPRKRHETFFDAIQRLEVELRRQAEFVVIGRDDGPYAVGLRAQSRKMDIDRDIVWVGWMRETVDIYNCLDVLVAPSLDEPFGMVVLEAAQFGIPSVLAKSGGFPEVVKDGETGLLFEPDDAVGLASIMRELIEDPGRVAQMGAAAKRFVGETFEAAAFCDKFAAEVHRICSAKHTLQART